MAEQIAVIQCRCDHPYQDRRYGPKNRVHNYALAGNNKAGGYRCTVCSNMKPTSSAKSTPQVKGGR